MTGIEFLSVFSVTFYLFMNHECLRSLRWNLWQPLDCLTVWETTLTCLGSVKSCCNPCIITISIHHSHYCGVTAQSFTVIYLPQFSWVSCSNVIKLKLSKLQNHSQKIWTSVIWNENVLNSMIPNPTCLKLWLHNDSVYEWPQGRPMIVRNEWGQYKHAVICGLTHVLSLLFGVSVEWGGPRTLNWIFWVWILSRLCTCKWQLILVDICVRTVFFSNTPVAAQVKSSQRFQFCLAKHRSVKHCQCQSP